MLDVSVNLTKTISNRLTVFFHTPRSHSQLCEYEEF